MNINKMLASLSRAKMMKGSGSELLNSAGAMGLASSLLNGKMASGKMGKHSKSKGASASKMGAMAMVGGLAWKAYKSYTEKQGRDRAFNQGKYAHEGEDLSQPTSFDYQPSSIDKDAFEAPENGSNSQHDLLLLRAMIAAAYADGHIDTTERLKIFDQVEQMGLSSAEKATLFDEMQTPLNLEQLVEAVPCSEVASQVYLASVMAIDLTCPEARVYLNKLAAMLCIPAELQASMESTIDETRISTRA